MKRISIAASLIAFLAPLPGLADMAPIHGVAQKEMQQFRQAAEQGASFLFYDIGWNYELGRGVKADEQEALRWYQRGAKAGDSRAQYRLGRYAQNGGNSFPRDLKQAYDWYLRAAGQGHPGAQHALSLMLAGGQGVKQDDAAAFRWIEHAAAQGNAEALHRLGFHLITGRGVARNAERARQVCQQAAEKGLDNAQFDLAQFYLRGDGVPRDVAMAIPWLERACTGLARPWRLERQALHPQHALAATGQQQFQPFDKHAPFQRAVEI